MKHLVTRAVLTAAMAVALPLGAHGQDPKDTMKDKMKDRAMMQDGMALATGTFAGADKHPVAGSYQIVTVDGKEVLQTSADLSVDPGAPDVYVVLSPGAKVGKKDAVWLGKLTSHSGAQSFTIPAGAKLEGLTQVVLWCKKFSATIGTASFDPSGLMHGMKDKMKPGQDGSR